MKDDFLYINSVEGYEKIVNSGGVKTTYCKNRFEVSCIDKAEINEQIAINAFRAWIKRREKEMRDVGDMSGEVS